VASLFLFVCEEGAEAPFCCVCMLDHSSTLFSAWRLLAFPHCRISFCGWNHWSYGHHGDLAPVLALRFGLFNHLCFPFCALISVGESQLLSVGAGSSAFVGSLAHCLGVLVFGLWRHGGGCLAAKNNRAW
jgi:hypothetical protein